MSHRDTNADRLFELAGAIFDEGASDSERLELSAMILADPASRPRYLDYCQIHIALRLQSRAHRASQTVHQQIKSGSAVPASAAPIAFQVETPTSLPAGLFSTTFGGTAGLFASGWPMAYLVATVIFGIGLLIGSHVYMSGPEQLTRQSAPLPSPLSPLPSVVGRITGMVDCQWAENPKSEIGNPKQIRNQNSPVSLGDHFALASGMIEITYDTGAKVILQGPVTYEVESPTGGYLSLGKLTARVEKDSGIRAERSERSGIPGPWPLAPGLFVIKTPTAIVTDLGTEFGVEVSREGVTETQVLVGAITVARAGDGSRTWEQTVRAGSAVRVDGTKTGPRAISASEHRFVRTLRSPSMDHAANYAKRVLAMQPVAYYRMEPPGDPKSRAMLSDSAAGAHHGMLHFSDEYVGEPYAPGRFGHSLRLRGSMVGDYAIVPDCPRTMVDRLTVSVWVYAMGFSGDSTAIIATNRGIHALSDEAAPLEFTLAIDGGSRCLETAVTEHDGKKIPIACEKDEFPCGKWQHVALVADGTVLHLYRNGLEVASVPCAGVLPGPQMANLDIGFLANKDGVGPAPITPYYWQGWIDELAIFNRALSSEELRELSVGTPTRQPPESIDTNTNRTKQEPLVQ